MKVTYIHHSGFLVETDRFYYLFDYEKGHLPKMDVTKPVFVLASHGHGDHYNPEVFSLLSDAGMQQIRAILSEDIEVPADITALQVSPGKKYELGEEYGPGKEVASEFYPKLTTFTSTDLGVAFLIEEGGKLIYHAGDLNDWVWEEESDSYNQQMTKDFRKQIGLLSEQLKHREIDVAFVVLDPRQGKDYDRGLCYFLESISVKQVYPMHYWGKPDIMETFLKEHPNYKHQIQKAE